MSLKSYLIIWYSRLFQKPYPEITKNKKYTTFQDLYFGMPSPTHRFFWWNCTQAYLHKQHLIFPNFYKKLGWNLKKFLSQQQNSTYNDTNLSIDCQTSRISQKCLNRFYRNSDIYFDIFWYILYCIFFLAPIHQDRKLNIINGMTLLSVL